jgi:hypothetical protein
LADPRHSLFAGNLHSSGACHHLYSVAACTWCKSAERPDERCNNQKNAVPSKSWIDIAQVGTTHTKSSTIVVVDDEKAAIHPITIIRPLKCSRPPPHWMPLSANGPLPQGIHGHHRSSSIHFYIFFFLSMWRLV